MIDQDSGVGNSRQKARKKMAKKYGSGAIKNKIVHHKDGDPFNNNITNLQIVNSQREHLALHKSEGIPKRKSTGLVQVSLPPESYKLLQAEAEKEKLRPATLALAILRRHLEGD